MIRTSNNWTGIVHYPTRINGGNHTDSTGVPSKEAPPPPTTNEEDVVVEPVTGIQFARFYNKSGDVSNRLQLFGCGVRKKYQLFNVYAVGFYLDLQDFAGSLFRGGDDEEDDECSFQEALLNPHNQRVIRIIMYRSLTMRQVIDAMKEALEPRMGGQDLQS